MPNTSVQPGDRFLRAGNPPTIWIVKQVLESPGMPPHVRIFREDRPTRTIVIAVTVLNNAKQIRGPDE